MAYSVGKCTNLIAACSSRQARVYQFWLKVGCFEAPASLLPPSHVSVTHGGRDIQGRQKLGNLGNLAKPEFTANDLYKPISVFWQAAKCAAHPTDIIIVKLNNKRISAQSIKVVGFCVFFFLQI